MRPSLLAISFLLLSTPALAKQAAPCSPRSTINVEAGGVRAVAFLPGGDIVTGNVDGTLRIYDVKKGKLEKTLSGHKAEVYSVAVAGGVIASGSEDKKVILWDAKSGKQKSTLSGHENTIRALAFTPDGKTLLSASLDRQLGSWDADAGKAKGMLGGQACILTGVATSTGTLKDGSPFAATSCNDGLVRIWNLRTGKPQVALEGHEGEVHSVRFSPADGNVMASGDNESKVIIWDVAGGKAVQTFENVGWTDAVAFSPDGALLVAAGNDMAQKGLFKIWETKNYKLLNEQFPHAGNITSVAFSPDGKTLLTAGMDETVKVWDVEQLKKGCGK